MLDSCGSCGLARRPDIVCQERRSGQNALGTYRWTHLSGGPGRLIAYKLKSGRGEAVGVS